MPHAQSLLAHTPRSRKVPGKGRQSAGSGQSPADNRDGLGHSQSSGTPAPPRTRCGARAGAWNLACLFFSTEDELEQPWQRFVTFPHVRNQKIEKKKKKKKKKANPSSSRNRIRPDHAFAEPHGLPRPGWPDRGWSFAWSPAEIGFGREAGGGGDWDEQSQPDGRGRLVEDRRLVVCSFGRLGCPFEGGRPGDSGRSVRRCCEASG